MPKMMRIGGRRAAIVDVAVVLLRTNGVDSIGAAAKVMNFDRLRKGTPWHFWDDKSRLTGVPKKSLNQKKRKLQ